MPITRRSRADIDASALITEMNTRPEPTEAEIEAMGVEDGDAWTDEDLAGAELVLSSAHGG